MTLLPSRPGLDVRAWATGEQAPQPSPPVEPVQPVRWWTRGAGLVVMLVLVACAVHVPMLHRDPWNSDEAYLATQAQVLREGGRLYVDTVDRKPPVVPLLYTATSHLTEDDGLLPIRLLAIGAEVLAALLLAVEARRRFRDERAGAYAGLLFLLGVAAFFPKDGQTANFEVFMLPAVIGAVMLAGRRRPLAAGLLLALAVLTKQTALFVWLPVAWLAWRAAIDDRTTTVDLAAGPDLDDGPVLVEVDTRPAALRAVAAVCAGLVAPILLAAVLFGWSDFTHWVFTANDGYLDASGAFGYVVRTGLHQTWNFSLAHAALVVLAVMAWRRRREHTDLWIWLLAGGLAASSGLRFFGHYYLELLPPLALIATGALVRLRPRAVTLVVVSLVASVVWFGLPPLFASRSGSLSTASDLARYAHDETSRDARILVWGHLPEVYWWSHRLPATRFETTGFLTGLSGGRPADRVGMQYAAPGAWDAFSADLRAHPPALVFDLSLVDVRNGAHFPPSAFPRFGEVLRRYYEPVANVDGVVVYARRPGA